MKIERRGFLGALAAGGLFLAARLRPRGRLVCVRIVRDRAFPFGVLPFDVETGRPVPHVTLGAWDGQEFAYVCAVGRLAVGEECSVEAHLLGVDGEACIVWPDGSLYIPLSIRERRVPSGTYAREHIGEEPIIATEWLRLRRVA